MVSPRKLVARLALAATALLPLASASNYETAAYDARSLSTRDGITTGATLCHTVKITAPLNLQACLTPATGILGQTLTSLLNIVTCNSVGTSAAAIIDINDSICLCVAAGVLTPASIAALNATITANGTAVNLLTSAIGGTVGYTATSLLSYLESVEPSVLGSYTPLCNYPTNSVPTSCSVCQWTCADGYNVCNGACIANTTTCPSQRRRRVDWTIDPDLRCPKGKQACLVPESGPWNGNNFECIDTSQDIESCGGCANPLPERPEGQDCTSIPNAQSVSCRNKQCAVDDCEAGFQSNGTACITNQEAMLLHTQLSATSTKLVVESDMVGLGRRNDGARPFQGRTATNEPGKGIDLAKRDKEERESRFWQHLQVKTDDLRAGKKGRGATRQDFEQDAVRQK